jgi:hypothetical protein
VGAVRLDRAEFGQYLLVHDATGEDLLVAQDWDYPGIAANLGFLPCADCRETDGTVSCHHRTARDMIRAAGEYLDDHIGDVFDDPGYFRDR